MDAESSMMECESSNEDGGRAVVRHYLEGAYGIHDGVFPGQSNMILSRDEAIEIATWILQREGLKVTK